MSNITIAISSILILLFAITNNGYAQTTIPAVEERVVELKSHKIKGDEFSDRLIGQVQNNVGKDVEYVQITTTFYDQVGDILATDFTYTDPTDLKPNMKAPFEMYLDEDVADGYESYDIMISWQYPDSSDEEVKVYEFASKKQQKEEEETKDEDE
jgi:hypothetical protein